MNEYRALLQARYFSLLSVALSVPVYDVMGVPATASYPHVQIGEFQEVEWSDFTSLGSSIQANVKVVDRATETASKAGIYATCGQIKAALRTRPVDAFGGIIGLNVVATTFVRQLDLPKETYNGLTYFGQILTFQHLIEQS